MKKAPKELIKRRKAKGERKESVIPVRCTADQKRALEEKAGALGMPVSTWLLSLGLSATKKP